MAVDDFEDLWDLDDGAEGDDADADCFGDEEGEAGAPRVDVEVEEEGFVAGGAEEGVSGLDEGGGEGVCEWEEVRAQEIHFAVMCCFGMWVSGMR